MRKIVLMLLVLAMPAMGAVIVDKAVLIGGNNRIWNNVSNMTTGDGYFLANGGVNLTWNRHASFPSMPASTNGELFGTPAQTTISTLLAFTADSAGGDSPFDANYAIHLDGAGSVDIYELGSLVSGGVTTYTTSDELSIRRSGTTVTYYKNGSLIYTSLTSSSSILYPIGYSISDNSGRIDKIRLEYD